MADARTTGLGLAPKKPDLEINKRGPGKFWQQPGSMLWLYVMAMLGSLWFWSGARWLVSRYTAPQCSHHFSLFSLAGAPSPPPK